MAIETAVDFRRALARVLPYWRADGIVDDVACDALRRRYRLDDVDAPAAALAPTAFALLGAIAIGAGIITFVAAHWSSLEPLWRFALVLGATVGAEAVGLVLRGQRRHAFAEAAFICGALAFGGAIALGAQEFNATLPLWEIYALWSAGLVPLAFVLRSVPVAVVALAAGAVSFPPHLFAEAGTGRLVAFVHFAAAVVVGASLVRRLGLLWFRELALAFAAIGAALVVGAASIQIEPPAAAIAVVVALALAAGAARSAALAEAAAALAFLVALLSTFWSFDDGIVNNVTKGPALDVFGTIVVLAIGAAIWRVRGARMLPFLPVAAALAAAILLPHMRLLPTIGTVIAANALVLVPALALMTYGLTHRARNAFMGGTAIFAVLGFLRFAEYDHDLTRKAMAFVVAGAAFVVCSVVFERRSGRGENAHAA